MACNDGLDFAHAGLSPAVWDAVTTGDSVKVASALAEEYGEGAPAIVQDALWALVSTGRIDPEPVAFLVTVMRLLGSVAACGESVH